MNRSVFFALLSLLLAALEGCGSANCVSARACLGPSLTCTVADASTDAAISGATFSGPTVGTASCLDSEPVDGGAGPCRDWRVVVTGLNAPVTISAPGYIAQTIAITTESGLTGACACPSREVQRDIRLTKA